MHPNSCPVFFHVNLFLAREYRIENFFARLKIRTKRAMLVILTPSALFRACRPVHPNHKVEIGSLFRIAIARSSEQSFIEQYRNVIFSLVLIFKKTKTSMRKRTHYNDTLRYKKPALQYIRSHACLYLLSGIVLARIPINSFPNTF